MVCHGQVKETKKKRQKKTKKNPRVPVSTFVVFANTYTPSGASRVALTPVARTLSMEANWISVAMVPTLTTFT